MLPNLQEGDKIAGSPYVVVGTLGQGGMGSVYEVRDTLLDVHRAVKLIEVDIERGPKREAAIAEVLKEGRIIAKLHRECPEHIVEVLSMGTTADARGTPYLVMELVPGATLSKVMQRRGGRLEAKQVRQVALEVLAALMTAHDNGIVHRDLKPANIMVQPIPGSAIGTRMKVIDFGITSEVGRRTVRRALTYKYGSPEQVHIEGPHPITAQTDLYALGIILFEAIVGRGPFDAVCKTPEQFIMAHLTHPAPSIASMVPGLPLDLARIIDSMLEKDPRKRPESARALGAKLTGVSWDFATKIEDDSQKTEENMTAALASAVEEAVEKRRRTVEAEQAQARPAQIAVTKRELVKSTPTHVSTTQPSPAAEQQKTNAQAGGTLRSATPANGVPAARKMVPTDPVKIAPSPRGNGSNAGAFYDAAKRSALPVAVARSFHVNETSPLPPELDTRGRRPSPIQRAIRALRQTDGTRIRNIAVGVAALFVFALVLVEVGVVVGRRHAASQMTSEPPTTITVSAATTAPVASPATSVTATASVVAVPAAASASVAADIPPAVTVAPPPAVSDSSNAATTTQAHAAPSAHKTAAHAAPSASASGSLSVDLGDGTRVPFNTERKLPGSGL